MKKDGKLKFFRHERENEIMLIPYKEYGGVKDLHLFSMNWGTGANTITMDDQEVEELIEYLNERKMLKAESRGQKFGI